MIGCVLRAIAAVAAAADDVACVTSDTVPPPDGLDDGFWIPPGPRPRAGGGAAAEIGNGEALCRRLPVRLRAFRPGLPVRLRAFCPWLPVSLRAFCPGLPVTPSGPARTGWTHRSGWDRWRGG